MIEFIEEGHIYLKDGIIIPSVSEILHFIFPNKYKDVPEWILDRKAEYGSKVHNSIECLDQNKELPKLDKYQEFSLNQYKRLKEKYDIKVQVQEMMINYKDIYCGRFDMVAVIQDNLCLCDIKTTAELDKEYLSWQLSLYELAFKYMYGTPNFDKLYAIWLPKKNCGELVEIERKSMSEILEVLRKFKESKKEVSYS